MKRLKNKKATICTSVIEKIKLLFILSITLILINVPTKLKACAEPGQAPPPGLMGVTPDTINSCTDLPVKISPNAITTFSRVDNVTFIYDWGDGSLDTIKPPLGFFLPVNTHIYTAVGDYSFVLVKNNPNGTDTTRILIRILSPPPSADFSISLVSCPYSFTDLSLDNGGAPIVSWNWDFQYGAPDTVQNPTHSYTTTGQYLVDLTVRNSAGCTSTFSDTINYLSDTNLAHFTYLENCPCNDLTFMATGTSNTYNWDFGDGTTGSGNTISHVFNLPEVHPVKLTGVAANGCEYTVTKNIDICPGETVYYPSKSNNNWFFPYKAGVTFNTGSPIADTLGQMTTIDIFGVGIGDEGGATMSDPITGNLLFYANQNTIWDANHTKMPNGDGLIGHKSDAQGVLIVPKPGNNKQYYVFTENGHTSPALQPYAVHYSIVDMNLRGGLGDVVAGAKNMLLTTTTGTEAMSTTLKKVNTCSSSAEYWLIIPTDVDIFSIYLINSSGIQLNHTQVFSGTSTLPNSLNQSFSSTISMSGQKYSFERHVWDFNNTTGILSNIRLVTQYSPYSTAFSLDDKVLYESQSSSIRQYDLTVVDINASQQTLVTIPSFFNGIGTIFYPTGTLWYGDDKKLYFPIRGTKNLGVINSPNVYGVGANIDTNGVDLNGRAGAQGLQNIVKLSIPIQDTSFAIFVIDTVNCLDVTFINLVSPLLYTDPCSFLYNNDTLIYHWDFGDGSPLLSTTSTGQFQYSFASSGTYDIQLVVERPFMCTTDTFTQELTITPQFGLPPNLIVSADTTICVGTAVQLLASGGANYIWHPGQLLTDSTLANPITTMLTTLLDTIIYQVVSQNLCGIDTAVTVITTGSCELFIPNAFSPNGDGVNDLFNIKSIGIDNASLKIYNRWGRLVYETLDPINEPWNGYIKGNIANEGVYIYVLRGQFKDDSEINKKGNVTLIR